MTDEQQAKPTYKFHWKRNAITFLVSALVAFLAVAAVSYFFGPVDFLWWRLG